MRNKTTKRALAILLTLVMVLGMLPTSVLAARMDDTPVAAVPAGEEAAREAVPETGGSRDSAQVLAAETAAAEIPGYTLVTAAANALSTDAEYLFVAWLDGAAYAFYPNAAGMSGSAGDSFAAEKNSNLTARLNITDGGVSATQYANSSASIDMSALHCTLSSTNGTSYGISGGGYNLTLNNSATGVAAPTAGSAFTVTKLANGSYKFCQGGSTGRYLEFFLPVSDNTIHCANFCGPTSQFVGVTNNYGTFTGGLYLYAKDTPEEEPTKILAKAPTERANYLAKASGKGWTFSKTPSAVTIRNASAANVTSMDAFRSGGTYQIHSTKYLGTFTPTQTNVLSTGENGDPGVGTKLVFAVTGETSGDAFTIRQGDQYLLAEYGDVTHSSNTWHVIRFGEQGAEFHISPVTDGADGQYYLWTTAEPEAVVAPLIYQMFDNSPANTWVFTGGADVEGGWDQTRGHRNFMGQFEEYVRWQNANDTESATNPSEWRQRYTTNTARKDLTLSTIVSEVENAKGWQSLVARFDPRAVVYMVGAEDAADSKFSTHLSSFISKATALRDNTGFAVIIKSYDSALAGRNAEVDAVVAALSDTIKSRVVVVTPSGITGMDAAGHLELGRQLCLATIGSANNYPCAQGTATFTEEAAPATYDTTKEPSVNVTEGTMTITLSGVDAFRYALKLESGVTISGTGADGTATVTDVPADTGYTLVTRSTDGQTQYKTVTAGIAQSDLQHRLAELVADKTTPRTWLFMGDSITHGALWTKGYDSISQTFDKYLDLLDRSEDVVINSAVSSATTASTQAAIQYRLKQFPAPDVVSIMLGTNDCSGIPAATTYKTNLSAIVDEIKTINPNAIVILRSPTGNWAGRDVRPYCEAMEAVATEKTCIYIDQYTETQGMLDTYSTWIKSNQLYFGNNLHPGAKGQLAMTKLFLKGTGLWNDDLPITNLDYTWVGLTEETSAVPVTDGLVTDGATMTMTLNVAGLGGNLGETTLTAAKDGQSWSVTAKAGVAPALTLPEGTYTVTAASLKTNETKQVTFASAEVWVGAEVEPPETSGYPEPSENKTQRYLDFGSSGWGGVTTPAALELHGVADGVYTKDTDGINSGVYGIYDPTPGDGGSARWMHVSGTGNVVTNQCGGQHAAGNTTHQFTFTYNAERKAYTIQSVNTGKYLTQTASGTQLAVNDTPTWFYITPTGGGTYYLWWETEPQPGGAIGEMFTITDPDNTWVFTGGADVAGSWDQTRGRRSFAAHFEEYVRNSYSQKGGAGGGENNVGEFCPTRQRYVINTAYSDLTLNTIVSEEGWQERVAAFSPRAAVYMVGEKDLPDEATFEEHLTAFINKATALREGTGFAVIMKSYDSTLSALNDKVDAAVAAARAASAAKCTHTVVVEPLTLTDAQKTASGKPNADGHLELGRQLAVAVGGAANNFPGYNPARATYTEAAMPVFAQDITPTVAFAEGNMTIGGLSGDFTYQVKLASGVTVSGAGANGAATVTDLPDGVAYALITRSADGATQYKTVTGLVGGGALPAKTGDLKKIADLVADKATPRTWLFIGDSITHGMSRLQGYESVAQLTEEYLDSIGREKDVVVNAAVSSATSQSTVNAREYRLDRFTADVAFIMLGTNDCSTNLTAAQAISVEQYKANLGTIVSAIRANNGNAVIVLRTPTGFWDSNHPQMSTYVNALKEFAAAENLILVDQMTATQGAINNYPWCKSYQFYGDALHPGSLGQLKMFQMLLRNIGLWDDDNVICNLDYLWTGMTQGTAENLADGLVADGNTLTLTVSALGADYGRTTLTATNEAGQSWSVLAEAGENPVLTLPDGAYTVTATSLKKSAAQEVTFASAEVTVSADNHKLPAPPEVVIYEYHKASGAFTEGIYAIVGSSVLAGDGARLRIIHAHNNTIDHCQINANDTPGGDTLTIDCGEQHLFNAIRSGSGFTFQVVGGSAAGKYLHGEGNTLSLSDAATVFTVDALTDGGYSIRWAEGKYLAWTGNFRAASATPYKLNLYKKTAVPPEMAQLVFKGTGADKPMDQHNPESYYRIPALTTLHNGWIVAASDIRWPNGSDSPNNLDTIVSISKDGGKTWDWEVVNYFSDFAPLKDAGTKFDSASFIDPALAVDKSGKLWMAVDLQPTHVNLGQNGQKTGSGFDENGLLMVAPISEADWTTKVDTNLGRAEATRLQYQAYYEYRVDVNNTFGLTVDTIEKNGKEVSLYPVFHKDDADRTPVGYYVDAFYDLWYDYGGEEGIKPVLVAQKDSNKATQANVFYKASPWKAYSTTYLMIRSAEVNAAEDGLDWSEPKLVSGVKRFDGETFLAFCPGRGTVVQIGETERIMFPVYDNVHGEQTSVVYTDDYGATWHRGERVANGNSGKTSESQVVILPGKAEDNVTPLLRIYSRNTKAYISYADSSDGGQTWTASYQDPNLPAVNTSNGCMVTFINLDGCLIDPDGKIYENLILAAYPRGNGRQDGMVRIGSIGTDENYTVTWLNDQDAVRYPGGYAYSCLTQLRDWTSESKIKEPISTFGLLYEGVPTYVDGTFEELLGEGWDWVLTKPTQEEIPSVTVTEVEASANTKDTDLLDLNVTATGTVQAEVRSGDGTVTWASSDPTVATVEAPVQPASLTAAGDGEDRTLVVGAATATVTAHNPGRAIITATSTGNGITRVTEIEVVVTAADANGAATSVTLPERYADEVVIEELEQYKKLSNGAAVTDETYVILAIAGARYLHNSGGNTDQCLAENGAANAEVTSNLDNGAHVWTVTAVDGGYTIQNGAGKYLTATASGNGQLVLNDTVTVFTIEHHTGNNYYVKNGDKYLAFNNNGWKMANTAADIQLYRHEVDTTYTASAAKLEALLTTAAADTAEYADILALATEYADRTAVDAAQARIDRAAQEVYAAMTGRTLIKGYTVIFTSEGTTLSTATVLEGSTVTEPADPTREGYTFDGWFNGNKAYDFTTPVTADLTLTAHWTENEVVPGDLSGAVLTVTPESVTAGGALTVTVTGIPADVTGVTLTMDGTNVTLTKDENGTYTGTAMAPIGEGQRTLVFRLRATNCEARRVDVSVTLTGGSISGPTGPIGGGSTGRPTTPAPVEEDLEDPDVPLAGLTGSFKDVIKTDWFFTATEFVAGAGLMKGVSETSFMPTMNTTRGMIVTILYRMEKEPQADPTSFMDVSPSSWYAAAAGWGEKTGIAKGMSDGNFNAMQDVTREQLAAFLYRYAEHRGYDVTARGDLTEFHDSGKVSAWATDAMSWAVGTGLINGKGAGKLDPLSTASRAEVAAILMRFCKNVQQG